jgi:hypothetical protein
MGSAAGRDTAVTGTAGLSGCSPRQHRDDHVPELYSRFGAGAAVSDAGARDGQ